MSLHLMLMINRSVISHIASLIVLLRVIMLVKLLLLMIIIHQHAPVRCSVIRGCFMIIPGSEILITRFKLLRIVVTSSYTA